MNQQARPHRHQSPEHEKIAQAYGLRVAIGKMALALGAGVALAGMMLSSSFRSPVAIGLAVLGGVCLIAFFVGDFPATVRCPSCGRRMRVRTQRDSHHHKRFRYLECPGCQQTIDLAERR
jgi:hypothetical protein